MESTLETAVQQRAEQRDRAAEDWHLDGMTDAAFGELPKYSFDAYLSGYVEGIRQLPNLNGRVVYGLTSLSEDEEF
jgi:hypothetical protein